MAGIHGNAFNDNDIGGRSDLMLDDMGGTAGDIESKLLGEH